MDFDDIVVGSGLSALAVVLGIDQTRKVLVVANEEHGAFSYYDDKQTVPCSFSGVGGLGNAWHGVIPTGLRNNFGSIQAEQFADLFRYFYPSLSISPFMSQPALFVPWKAIRPKAELARLKARRGDRLTMLNRKADGISMSDTAASVEAGGQNFRAKRVWIAAGALGTPDLLSAAFGRRLDRGLVSDHAFCYIGQTAQAAVPQLTRSKEGIVFPATYNRESNALYTLRPARFAFKKLDFGIEQRAVFGLPTGNAVAKIARRASPGLLAEAFFNRFGLFPKSSLYSVYSQVVAADAYEYTGNTSPIELRLASLTKATAAARDSQPYKGVIPSKLLDAFIPGIHLHDSLDRTALARLGINVSGSPVQIVDASVLSNIGPDHHSFKMMISACHRAQAANVSPRANNFFD
jgi:hypothetical protein